MSGYTKLFNTIVGSTIWREPPEVCKLWITMLAIADRDGLVEASIPGLADFARIPMERVKSGLELLLAPDPDSRTPDNEGRRIERVNGGWRILNYNLYRRKHSVEEIREQNRIRQQRHRDHVTLNRDSSVTKRDKPLRSVTARDSALVTRERERERSKEKERENAKAEAYALRDVTERDAQVGEHADDFFQRIKQIGFRDSESYGAMSEFSQQLSQGADAHEMLASLARIYRWTFNGKYVRDLYTALRRWREPQHLWTRDNHEPQPSSIPVKVMPKDHIECLVCHKDLGVLQPGEEWGDFLCDNPTCEQIARERNLITAQYEENYGAKKSE